MHAQHRMCRVIPSWSADCVLMGKQNDFLDYQNANIYPDVVNINGINELSLLTL